MTPKWIRQVFAPKSQFNAVRRIKGRKRGVSNGVRIDFVELEDRSVPSGTAPFISFSNALITSPEGTPLSRLGYVGDAEGDPLTLSANIGSFVFTGNPGALPGSQEVKWSYTPANGFDPPLTNAVTVSVSDGTSTTPSTFNLSVTNVAPTLTAPATQNAIAGKSMGFNLGSFTDPGTEPNWTVQVDWTNDGSYDTTFTTSTKGALFATNTYATVGTGTYTVKVLVTDPDGGSDVKTFTVSVASDVTPTYVDGNWTIALGGDIGPAGLSAGDTVGGGHTFGYDAWSTITDALAVTSAGGTVNVAAGKYAENLAVGKAVSLLGPNAGIAGTGVRGAEAVIVPAAASTAVVVDVSAANVTIDGFTIDGDNTAIGGGVAVNGADANAATGVQAVNVGGLTVRNNVIQNFTSNGVNGVASGTPVGGSLITANKIDNVPLNGTGGFFGRGVLIQDNFYASVTNNTITRARTGIQTNNFSQANPGAAASVSGNTISAYVRGVFHNLHYNLASPFVISNNTLTAEAGSPTGNGGLIISSIQDAVSATISGNNVSGFDSDLYVWNIPTTAGITISGGTIGNAVSYGLNFNNRDAGFGDAAGTANLTLSGVTFAATNPTAVRVFDDPANATGSTLSLGMTGVTVNGNATGTGLLLSGSDAKLVGNTLGNTAFAGFTGTSRFVTLANAAYAGATVDGTGASYNGALGSALTRATSPTGFAVEDRITHYLDDPTLGFVRTTPSATFVTSASGSIQRAINQSGTAGGDTVYVAAGAYAEQLLIDRGLTLTGPNDGKSAGATPVGRAAEAVITVPTGTADLSGAGVGLVRVTASNVTIDGFTIDGDNTGTSGGTAVLSGADSNARRGVVVASKNATLAAVNVRNSFVRNFYGRGVQYGFSPSELAALGWSTSVTGGDISDDGFSGIGDTAFNDGFASLAYDGRPNFTGNAVTNANVGPWYQFLYTQNSQLNVTNNTVNVAQIGMGLNETGAANAPISISGNTFTVGTSGLGIQLTGVAHTGGTTISNNTFTGSGGAGSQGIYAWGGVGGPSTLTVSGGSIGGFETAAFLTNGDVFGPTSAALSLTLNNVAVSVPAGGTGVQVDGSTATGAAVSATISGTTSITGAGTGVGLALAGSKASAAVSGGTISGLTTGIDQAAGSGALTVTGGAIHGNTTGVAFAGGTAAVGGVSFARGGGSPNATDIRLTGATGFAFGSGITFDADGLYIDDQTATGYDLTGVSPVYANGGTTYNPSTTADAFRIEDRIYHKVDDTTKGLVTFRANNVFVTAPGTKSGSTTDTDSSIQGGIDAVPNGSTGWTVNVEAGSYAQAAVVNESITLLGAGKTTTTVTAPANANNAVVTITAPNATVDGFTLVVDQGAGVLHGVYGSGSTWTGTLVQNNTVTTTGSTTGNQSRGILFDDPTSAQAVTIRANAVTGNGTSRLWRGISLSQVKTAIVGGATAADGNTVNNTVVRDLQVEFAGANGTTLVANNTFGYAGINVTEPNGGHAVTIQNNAITGFPASGSPGLFVNHNYAAGATVAVTGNTFTVQNNDYGLLSSASQNVTVTGNTFSPAAGATAFALLVVDTQMRDGQQNGPLVPSSVTATGNTFNGGGTTGGVGVAFYNGNSTMVTGAGVPSGVTPFGTITLGGAGANANSFANDLKYFIQLNSTQNPLFAPVTGGAAGAVAKDIDASGNTFDVGDGQERATDGTFTLANKFTLEQKLFHKPDNSALGFITTIPGDTTVYVPNTQTIQGGIDAVPNGSTGWTVRVQAGTYNEDVIVNESIQLLGAGSATTTILGTKGDATLDTVAIPAANVTVAGFTITRDGNTVADWNNANGNLNNQGVTIYGTNTVLRDNVVTGNRNGVYIDGGANNPTVRNNDISNNRTGVHVVNVTNGVLIEENVISNNWTIGILFRNEGGAAGTGTGPLVVRNNSITDNWYTGIERRNFAPYANVIDAAGNWFGTAAPKYVLNSANTSGEPGYSGQIPVAFGGSATPPSNPALRQDVLDSNGTSLIDFTPFLWTGDDTNVETQLGRGTNGFQGDFSQLGVTANGAQIQSGGRINEAINYDGPDAGTAPDATTVHVLAGTYTESPLVNRSLQLLGAGKGSTFINLLPDGTAGAPYLGALTISGTGSNVTVDGFTIRGNDAVGSGLANTDVLLDTKVGTVTLSNNRFEVGAVGTGSNGDDGMGVLTTYTDTAADFAATLNVTGNAFTPRTTTANRAFFVNTGVTNLLVDNNTITGNFESGSFTSAKSGVVSNNTYDGQYTTPGSRLGGLGAFGYPNETYGQTTFSNNTVTNAGYGVRVVGANNVTVSGNTLSNTDVGLRVSNDYAVGFNPATLTVAGNTFTNNVYHADYTAANNPTAEYTLANATPNTFDGVTLDGSTTTAQLFAIADKVLDKVDGGSTYGLIRLRAGNVYVTPNSFVAPTTTTPDINRAILGGSNGDVVNVAAGTYPNATNLTNATQTVRLQGNVTMNSLAGVSGSTLDLNGNTLTYGDATNATFNGVFVGTGTSAAVKQGTGTSTLTGASTGFTGALNVNAGAVELTGSVGGNATVNSGGTLTGTGTVGGTLTNSGTVSPGAGGTPGIGTLNAGGYVQTSGGNLVIDVQSGGTPVSDRVAVSATGTAALAGTLTLNGVGGTGTPNYATLKLIDNANPAAGATTGAFSNLTNGQFVTVNGETFLFSNPGGDGNDVTLLKTPTSTPVGSTYANTAWTGLPNGTVVDVDPVTAGTQPGFIGFDAYSMIQPAINVTTPVGTVVVFTGTYSGDSANLSGTQTLRLFTGAAVTLNGPISGPTGSTINLNRGTLTVGDGTNTTVGSRITGVGPSNLVKQGGGTLTLTNPANDYKGSTTVSAGTLLSGADEVIPDGSAVTVAAGATLNLAGYYESIGSLAGSGNVVLDSIPLAPGGLSVGGNNTNAAFGGAISGAGNLVKVGTGAQTFTAAQGYGGGTRIDSGSIKLSGAASLIGSVDTGSGTLELNLTGPATFANTLTGNGSVTVSGTGTTELTGANTYTGGTTVNAGTLLVPDFSKLGTGPIAANGAAQVQVSQTQTTGQTFTLSTGATLSVASGKTLTLNAAQVTGGTLSGPGAVATTGGAQLVGVNVAADVALTVSGSSSFISVTNNGRMSVPAGVTATLTTFTNAAGGRISVNGGGATANVSNFTSSGYLEIINGGLFSNVGIATMTFGAGSVINIGYTTPEVGSATTAGTGTFDLGDANALIRTGVLRHNGDIRANAGPIKRLILENGSTFYTGDGNGTFTGSVLTSLRSGSQQKSGY